MLVAVFVSIACVTLALGLIAQVMSARKLRNNIRDLHHENKALRDRAEMVDLLARTSHIGSWTLDLDSQALSWSEELYRIYGFDNPDFVPDTELQEQLIVSEHREKVARELAAAVSNQRSFAMEYQVMLPSGTRKYILGQGCYLKKQHRLVGTVQDITELKDAVLKLRVNESLLREAEAVSHNGSWELADGKEFMLWSDEMYLIHGLLPHSVFMTVNFYRSLVHEADLQHFIEGFSQPGHKKSSFKVNYRIIRPSGEIRHVLSTAEYKKIGFNERYAYIGTTQDVTELREAQVQLEEKVVELNRSNQDLEQFAYVASHDLQEPLRKIQAFGSRLSKKVAETLDAEALDYIDRMQKAAERMRILIHDLLSFSKATKDAKAYVKLNLSAVLDKTLKDLDLIIDQKGATLNLSVDLEIEGIESQLIQLFQNLLANALKFAAPGLSPVVSVGAEVVLGSALILPEANQNQTYALVKVTDNGIGFEEEDANRIFDIFQRLHSRTGYEGTGIGLAICKKIVANHSGFIFATSEQGKGSTFSVVLPLKQMK